MIRKLTLVIAAVFAMGLSGCSSNTSHTPSPTSSEPTSTTVPATHEITTLQTISPPIGFRAQPQDSGGNRTGIETATEEAKAGPENGNVAALKRMGWQSGVLAYWVKGSSGYASNQDSIELSVERFLSPADASGYLSLAVDEFHNQAGKSILPIKHVLLPGTTTTAVVLEESLLPPNSPVMLFVKGTYYVSIIAFNGSGGISVPMIESLAARQSLLLPG